MHLAKEKYDNKSLLCKTNPEIPQCIKLFLLFDYKHHSLHIVTCICLFLSSLVHADNIIKIKPLSNIEIFDVGLAHINNDDIYDIYTANHNNAESILLYENGNYVEKGLTLGLKQAFGDQDYEPTGTTPDLKNGLNVYSVRQGQIILFCQRCESDIEGSIRIPAPIGFDDSIKLVYKNNASQSLKLNKDEPDKYFIDINFSIKKNGILVYKSKFTDVIFNFKVNIDSNAIYIGPTSKNPDTNNFKFNTRDNHSLAWAKVNNDKYSDVFISSGGLRAQIRKFHPSQIPDESLYFYDSEKNLYVDVYKNSGLDKNACRTYNAEWIDIDNDQDLDLYIGCKNGPNQLYIQDGVGSGFFKESAKKYGLDIHTGDEFKWIDLNNDSKVDLLVLEKNKLVHYQNPINNSKKFVSIKKSKLLGKKLDSVNSSIKVADITSNGQIDIFVTTNENIFYFKITKHMSFSNKKLKFLRLPENISGRLNIVDVNLDGRLDLVIFNHGIYIQNNKGKFKKLTKDLKLINDIVYKFKNLIWFDIDQNGSWDVLNTYAEYSPKDIRPEFKNLKGYKYQDFIEWVNIRLHKNVIKSKNNWLQIDLIGTEFNQDAIGAKIIVNQSSGNKQYRYNSGTQDSNHGQGHYRHYFGLLNDKTADITILWPDGKIQKLLDVKSNQLIKIKHQNLSILNMLQKLIPGFLASVY